MREKTLLIPCDAAELSATLTLPDVCRGAVVLLHPADDPSRDQFLFQHLAGVMPERGIAVARYDRRAGVGDRDVPYQVQVEDLKAVLVVLAGEVGAVPTGLWGFSQGAWVSLLAAAQEPTLAFLVLVGCSAVSPARQMRYGVAEQLTRAGFGPRALTELRKLRDAWEAYQRGDLSRDTAQAVVDNFAGRRWMNLSWVPATLPDEPGGWDDMDFDPAAAISRICCPVLAFYGDDEWVPVRESISVWRKRFTDASRLTIRTLDGTDHHPTLDGGRSIAAISPEYTATITSWLDYVLANATETRPADPDARPQ